jgi:hypothetical protein
MQLPYTPANDVPGTMHVDHFVDGLHTDLGQMLQALLKRQCKGDLDDGAEGTVASSFQSQFS